MSEALRIGPVLPHERIQLLDVLRGFALFGILQVNFGDWEGALNNIMLFFIDGSFYTMFSFLFGLGFAIQLIRAEDRKAPFAARYLWRSVLLFGIGAAHYVFIWTGDIVRTYGLVAIVLLVIHRLRTKVLLVVAAALLIAFMAPSLRPRRGAVLVRPSPEATITPTSQQREQAHLTALTRIADDARAEGEHVYPYLIGVSVNAARIGREIRQLDLTWLWGNADILAMFIFGLVFGRKRILHEPAKHRGLLLGIMAVGFVIGVLGNASDTFSEFLGDHGVHIPTTVLGMRWTYSLGNIGLAFFYVTLLTLLFTYRDRARRILAPLAYVGRMGLTNYLMQSVVMVFLLYPGGLNLSSKVHGWNLQLLLNVFFVVQILYSAWWFRRFQFGPVEWCWRSLTWFRFPPMRRVPVVAEPVVTVPT